MEILKFFYANWTVRCGKLSSKSPYRVRGEVDRNRSFNVCFFEPAHLNTVEGAQRAQQKC